ncbi:MAG: GNAT family N-acetyltransferase [Rhodospirillales bacterium]|nr:GNAT family N-acetyltransferase [Rhodospirillales bacterium]
MSAAFDFFQATSVADMAAARQLFREYQDGLTVAACFQDFERELEQLPGPYAPPDGHLYLARERNAPALAGCVAIRPAQAGYCEMKRLYVRPPWRGRGLGRQLAALCLQEATAIGYRYMCLDTVGFLTEARALYSSMGFRETTAYDDNPSNRVISMEIALKIA